jgi:hypothetical protein
MQEGGDDVEQGQHMQGEGQGKTSRGWRRGRSGGRATGAQEVTQGGRCRRRAVLQERRT